MYSSASVPIISEMLIYSTNGFRLSIYNLKYKTYIYMGSIYECSWLLPDDIHATKYTLVRINVCLQLINVLVFSSISNISTLIFELQCPLWQLLPNAWIDSHPIGGVKRYILPHWWFSFSLYQILFCAVYGMSTKRSIHFNQFSIIYNPPAPNIRLHHL